MGTTQVKYVEWLNPEDMHTGTQDWLSELQFIKEEQRFFDDLVKSYTLQLIDSKHYKQSKDIVGHLADIHKETNNLIKIVKKHNNGLEVMVDKVDQPKEETAYKKAHKDLVVKVKGFLKTYKTFKNELFNLIKQIIKEQKQKRLLSQ